MNLIKRVISALWPTGSRPLTHATDPQETPTHSPRLEVNTEAPTVVTVRSTNFR